MSERGYSMLHEWIIRSDAILEFSTLLLLNITQVPGSQFIYIWCFKRLMHDGAFSGDTFGEWDCCEKCGVISDASKSWLFNFRRARWMVKKKKRIVYTHTHMHPPLLKKNTRSHGSTFCCDIFFIYQHELKFQLQMALEIEYTMLSPFALALDFESRFNFYFYLLLKLCCMSRMSCTLLCVCVWVCRIKNMEGGERMNKWRECNR